MEDVINDVHMRSRNGDYYASQSSSGILLYKVDKMNWMSPQLYFTPNERLVAVTCDRHMTSKDTMYVS